jgi:N-acetylmuramoyl-L-alanine amidase
LSVKILLDRGHSQTAKGAMGYLDEQYINEVYVNAIVGWIKYFGGDVEVLPNGPTVTTDIAVPVARANQYGTNAIMLSVHANSAADKTASGFEVIVQRGKNTGTVKALSEYIYGNYKIAADRYGMKARGIKEMDLGILRNTKPPACLIELGFVSNQKDSQILTTPDFVDAQTKIIARTLMGMAGQTIIEPKPADPVIPVEVPQLPLSNSELKLLREIMEKYKAGVGI